jgi:hypothetical protein
LYESLESLENLRTLMPRTVFLMLPPLIQQDILYNNK